MVTKINERASKNETREMVENPNGKGQISIETATFKADMKAGNEAIDTAIKARSESFGLLTVAAGHALLFYAKHGRTELINRLFVGLMNSKSAIDSENFRQSYIPRVVEEFGVGGEKELDESGAETGKWKKRNTPVLTFNTNPDDKHSYFAPANYKKGATPDAVRQSHVSQTKANMLEAGLEGLQAVAWIKQSAIIRPDQNYERTNFENDITRILSKAIKAGAIPVSQAMDVQRVAGLQKNNRAKLAEVISEANAAPEAKADDSKSETPADEKQAA